MEESELQIQYVNVTEVVIVGSVGRGICAVPAGAARVRS
jgi:hypothetical protein